MYRVVLLLATFDSGIPVDARISAVHSGRLCIALRSSFQQIKHRGDVVVRADLHKGDHKIC